MGTLDYTAITRHRRLWPLIELGAILLYVIRENVLAHEQRNAARCRASHCAHH